MTGKTRAEILNPRVGVSGEMLVTRIHLGNLRILMLPRLTPESSRQLLETISPETLRSEVLLFPLGGAEMTSTLRLIRAVGPRVLVTPVGGIGRDAFPGQEWDGVLSAEGITLMRQDETGAVILEADPKAPKAVPFLHPDQPVPLDRVHRSDSKKAFD
jgi:beta-lactamase superfamily II metal-dependent hydrolase